MHKTQLSERDICTKFITPALVQAGWDVMAQIREEVYFTKGRIIVRGKLVTRGKAKRADYILYLKPNIPLALIEAKDNNHRVGDGRQQGKLTNRIRHEHWAATRRVRWKIASRFVNMGKLSLLAVYRSIVIIWQIPVHRSNR